MRDLRLWIAVLALSCLAAGAGGGLLAARWITPAPRAEPTGAFPDYERMLAGTFDLSPERRELLRVVLESYRDDVERIKDRHMADYMSSIEPELRERGRYYRGLVRNKVLPEAGRAEFDLLSLGTPATH